MPRNVTKVKPLLVGGGVGTAPMLMLGAELVKNGMYACFPARRTFIQRPVTVGKF